MLNNKHVIVALAVVSVLLGSLLVDSVILAQGGGEYDPWIDTNDDGVIDVHDLNVLASVYGTSGEVINKTALLLELLGRVETLETAVDELKTINGYLNSTTCPIGAIIPCAVDLAGVPLVPESFVECNGQILNDPESPLHGQTMPNLNGENRFLRGSSASGATGGSEIHSHSIGTSASAHFDGGDVKGHPGGTSGSSSLPPYYDVVWIMRVK